MNNIVRIFSLEIRNLFKNVLTVMLAIGLVLMPSLFTWYNVLSCWDVFDNTGNVTVAVANTDAGYKSDLFPVEVNAGEQVVSALRENDQINWTFVSEEDALDGVYAGRYYAAVVIPKDFSRTMLTFYQDDAEQSPLTYYTNDKLNAIAPKITQQGANGISEQVNQIFAETLADISLGFAQSISNYAESADLSSTVANIADTAVYIAGKLDDVSSTLGLYVGLANSSQVLLNSSATLIGNVQGSAENINSIANDATSQTQDTVNSLQSAANGFSNAIASSLAALETLETEVPDYSNMPNSQAAAQQLRERADALGVQIAQYEATRDALAQEAVDKNDPDLNAEMIAALDDSITSMQQLQSDLLATAADIEAGNVNLDPRLTADHVEAAKEALQRFKDIVDEQLQPKITELEAALSTLDTTVAGLHTKLDSATNNLSNTVTSASAELGYVSSDIASVQADLQRAAVDLRNFSKALTEALASGDTELVQTLLSSDVSTLSAALAAPVAIERHSLFTSEHFGVSMFPLYATIGLFVGALLIMVLIKPRSSDAVLDQVRENGPLAPRHEFFGHFGICAVLSLAQSTVLGLGSIFFLDVKPVEPLLFMLCFWIASLVFTFFLYVFVVSFANLGKAVGVILLVIQVTGCNGSYPVQILPDFVQIISPFLPATHVVAAMRSALFGVYAGDFWIQIACVLLYLIPALLLGLWLRKPFARFMAWYLERVESSNMMA